jgi:hypothetical protein
MMAPQDFQLVNCVPSVFVDGTGLGAKDTRAGVPDDLRHEERRNTRLRQPTRQRMTQVINPRNTAGRHPLALFSKGDVSPTTKET